MLCETHLAPLSNFFCVYIALLSTYPSQKWCRLSTFHAPRLRFFHLSARLYHAKIFCLFCVPRHQSYLFHRSSSYCTFQQPLNSHRSGRSYRQFSWLCGDLLQIAKRQIEQKLIKEGIFPNSISIRQFISMLILFVFIPSICIILI